MLSLSSVSGNSSEYYYLLTDWLAYLYGRIQSPRPDVMSNRREENSVFVSILKNSNRSHKSRFIRLFSLVNTAFVRAMYKQGTGNDKQRKTREIEHFARIKILVRQ